MSSTVTELAMSAAGGQGDYSFIAAVLLVVLLIERELLSAYSGGRASGWSRTLVLAWAPLLVSFCVLVGAFVSSYLP